jgi:hypothetical protein
LEIFPLEVRTPENNLDTLLLRLPAGVVEPVSDLLDCFSTEPEDVSVPPRDIKAIFAAVNVPTIEDIAPDKILEICLVRFPVGVIPPEKVLLSCLTTLPEGVIDPPKERLYPVFLVNVPTILDKAPDKILAVCFRTAPDGVNPPENVFVEDLFTVPLSVRVPDKDLLSVLDIAPEGVIPPLTDCVKLLPVEGWTAIVTPTHSAKESAPANAPGFSDAAFSCLSAVPTCVLLAAVPVSASVACRFE